MTRREMLAGASGAGLGFGLAEPSSARPPASLTLGAYVETLIPDDELSPGALRLGVADRIAAAASQDDRYRRLLDEGCRWLDGQAAYFGRDSFAALTEVERERIALQALREPPGSLPRVFFEETQAAVFQAYWSQPEAWAGIGYAGPPQPEGFMDFTEPPAKV